MNLHEWKQYVLCEATGKKGVFPQGHSFDYRERDRNDMNSAYAMLESALKHSQAKARALNQLAHEGPEISAHYSMAVTNATRAIKLATRLLMYSAGIMREAEESWIKDKGKTDNPLVERMIGILIRVEDALGAARIAFKFK